MARRRVEYLGVGCPLCGFVHTNLMHLEPAEEPKCHRCERPIRLSEALMGTTLNSHYDRMTGEYWLDMTGGGKMPDSLRRLIDHE